LYRSVKVWSNINDFKIQVINEKLKGINFAAYLQAKTGFYENDIVPPSVAYCPYPNFPERMQSDILLRKAML
jgi:hypothetical protein